MIRSIVPIVGLSVALVLAGCATQPDEAVERPASAEQEAAAATAPEQASAPAECDQGFMDGFLPGSGIGEDVVMGVTERTAVVNAVAAPTCGFTGVMAVEGVEGEHDVSVVLYLDSDEAEREALVAAAVADAQEQGWTEVPTAEADVDLAMTYVGMNLETMESTSLIVAGAAGGIGAMVGLDYDYVLSFVYLDMTL